MVLSDRDRELLNRCLAGMDGAWEAFVEHYLALITHVVQSTAKVRYSQLPDDLRDELVAEILLALVDDDYAILRRFRGQSSLGTYLVVVARRIAARRLARMTNSIQETQAFAAEQNASGEGADASRELEDREEVQDLLGKLPAVEAKAIRMFHLEHRSYSEIGQQLGIPENSVGPLLTKARHHMRSLKLPANE